jgi:methylenetetrahydrofolate reductase (NADPH)
LKTFRQALQAETFSITAELSLRRETPVKELLRQAERMSPWVDGFQVAESPHTWVQMSPVAAAALLLAHGFDAVPQLTCRDRNRIALLSDLLGLRASGVTSVILNKGSRLPRNSRLRGQPVFDLSCRELIALARSLNDEDGVAADCGLLIGTAATAFAPKPDWTPELLLARAGGGAHFLQTQPCFNLEVLRRFMQRLVAEKITWQFAAVVTLAPLPSAESAAWLANSIRGALIPPALIERLRRSRDPETEGVDICAELLREIAGMPGVSGVNLLTLGNPEAVNAAIAAAGLRNGGSTGTT